MLSGRALCDGIAATLRAGITGMRVETPARLSEKPIDLPLIQVLPRRAQVSGFGTMTSDRLTFGGETRVWVWNIGLYAYARLRGSLQDDLQAQMELATQIDGVLDGQREGALFGLPTVQGVFWSWEFRALSVGDGTEYSGLLYDLTVRAY